MLQTQKLESLGVLSGGIAHDFNNLLTSILGNADLARSSPELPNLVRERLDDVVSASRRAADLTGQLLAYSGKGRFLIEAVDLIEIIRETGQLLSVSIGKNIKLVYDLPDHLPAIQGDRAQLQQILMNLIINASEAIEDRPGIVRIGSSAVPDGNSVPGPVVRAFLYNQVHRSRIGNGGCSRHHAWSPRSHPGHIKAGNRYEVQIVLPRGYKWQTECRAFRKSACC